MSVQTDPVPPVPEHTPPLKEDAVNPNSGKYFSQPWTRWFVSLRDKINVINESLVNLGNVSGSGFIAKIGAAWVTRNILGTSARISVTPGDGSADAVIDLVNTAVTPGSYTNADITVGADGRLTAASNGSGGGASIEVVLGSGTGTAYTLTTTSAALNFGTSDPQITIPSSGVWLIYGAVQLDANSATTSNHSVNIKLRRTNNAAGDLTNGGLTILAPNITTTTQTLGQYSLPIVSYTTSNNDDTITMYGSISSSLGAGTITSVSASIYALRYADFAPPTISYIGGNFSINQNSGTATLNVPGGATAGDLVICVLRCREDRSFTIPVGWTTHVSSAIQSGQSGTNYTRVYIVSRILAAETSFSFTQSTAAAYGAAILIYRNGTVITSQYTNGNSSAITKAQSYSMLLAVGLTSSTNVDPSSSLPKFTDYTAAGQTSFLSAPNYFYVACCENRSGVGAGATIATSSLASSVANSVGTWIAEIG